MALLRHAAQAFHRRGLARYALAVDSESLTGATRLYERAGMHAAHTYAGYLKELRPGVEPTASAVSSADRPTTTRSTTISRCFSGNTRRSAAI